MKFFFCLFDFVSIFRHYSTIAELREAKSLPPIEAFFSDLKNEHITKDDYAHAHAVWKTFNCETMADYTSLYCLLDVLLLAEAFENFRTFSLQEFLLDPAYYIGIPGLR